MGTGSLVGWWVAQDDKAVLIASTGRGATADSLLVSVFPSPGAEPYRTVGLHEDDARPVDRMAATLRTQEDGVRYLQIEAGYEGLGPTYHLYPVVRDPDGGWCQPADLTSPAALLPDVGIGLYDDWDDDLGVPWAFPLLPLVRTSR